MKLLCIVAAFVVSLPLALLPEEQSAEACGCTSPPVPPPDGPADFAVNQSAEQIIFEVEEGFVTAHVLIRYAGRPEEFAWIVPVPAVPELSLSQAYGFAMLDRETQPQVVISTVDECPVAEWTCKYAEMPFCDQGGSGCVGCSSADSDVGSFVDASAGGASDAGGGPGFSVEVLDRQVVGSYETVVFSAGDTAEAVLWLQSEGFIVNETMSPYMQPYADAGMLFLASKLVAGADTSAIQPLKMRYAADNPMIPLRLTAIAAEPEMGITTFIYGNSFFGPADFPLAEIDQERLVVDADGRNNYPMVLSRAVDDAGGKSFVAEYVGNPVIVDFDQGTGCCDAGVDICGWGDDGLCSCPDADFEANDCEEDGAARLEGAAFVNELASKYTALTRLTTRMSAEDMTYDPAFVPQVQDAFGRLSLGNSTHSLDACLADIVDPEHYEEIQALQVCATTYCGTGSCVVTSSGAACDCDAGSVSRIFTDLDGARSVTCVPDVAPVDLAAGGLDLPDPCATINCGLGTCLNVGGFATCQCDPGTGGDATKVAAPTCLEIIAHSNGPGAEDYSQPLVDLPVCAPAPPDCGAYGWNIRIEGELGKRGFECASSLPSEADQQPVNSPTCADLGERDRSGCTAATTPSGLMSLLLFGFVFFFAFGRRRFRSSKAF